MGQCKDRCIQGYGDPALFRIDERFPGGIAKCYACLRGSNVMDRFLVRQWHFVRTVVVRPVFQVAGRFIITVAKHGFDTESGMSFQFVIDRSVTHV